MKSQLEFRKGNQGGSSVWRDNVKNKGRKLKLGGE